MVNGVSGMIVDYKSNESPKNPYVFRYTIDALPVTPVSDPCRAHA